jgi:hypothetical protein
MTQEEGEIGQYPEGGHLLHFLARIDPVDPAVKSQVAKNIAEQAQVAVRDGLAHHFYGLQSNPEVGFIQGHRVARLLLRIDRGNRDPIGCRPLMDVAGFRSFFPRSPLGGPGNRLAQPLDDGQASGAARIGQDLGHLLQPTRDTGLLQGALVVRCQVHRKFFPDRRKRHVGAQLLITIARDLLRTQGDQDTQHDDADFADKGAPATQRFGNQ